MVAGTCIHDCQQEDTHTCACSSTRRQRVKVLEKETVFDEIVGHWCLDLRPKKAKVVRAEIVHDDCENVWFVDGTSDSSKLFWGLFLRRGYRRWWCTSLRIRRLLRWCVRLCNERRLRRYVSLCSWLLTRLASPHCRRRIRRRRWSCERINYISIQRLTRIDKPKQQGKQESVSSQGCPHGRKSKTLRQNK